MWLHTLVMIRGLVGGTHDKVKGHSAIQMEAWGNIVSEGYWDTVNSKYI